MKNATKYPLKVLRVSAFRDNNELAFIQLNYGLLNNPNLHITAFQRLREELLAKNETNLSSFEFYGKLEFRNKDGTSSPITH